MEAQLLEHTFIYFIYFVSYVNPKFSFMFTNSWKFRKRKSKEYHFLFTYNLNFKLWNAHPESTSITSQKKKKELESIDIYDTNVYTYLVNTL